MSVKSQEETAELLRRIESALAFADEVGATDVGIHLDQARVAAGGSGMIDAHSALEPTMVEVITTLRL